jgi:hypothetical protein
MPETRESAAARHEAQLADALALAAAPAEAAGFAYIALVESTAGALQNAVTQQQSYQLVKRAQTATTSAAILRTAIDLPPLVSGSDQALGLEAEQELQAAGEAAGLSGSGEQTDALLMAAWAYGDDVPEAEGFGTAPDEEERSGGGNGYAVT